MRVGYFGPEGTFTEEALLAQQATDALETRPYPTIHDTVMAVQAGEIDRALVPIENSLEGSVGATLDTLAVDAPGVEIVGEAVHPIHHCLIAGSELALEEIATVVSHPQPLGQCARFLRERLPTASVLPATSTVDAVRTVVERDDGWAAIGTRRAAELYGGLVLASGIEDVAGNETRFVWLAPAGTPATDTPAGAAAGAGAQDPGGTWKTSIVFWGAGDDHPGWLVRCLSEFAFRGVNLTMIESRPRRRGLGHYMFFADVEGRAGDEPVARAIGAVRAQTEAVRVLGSYPTA
jgi:prephenate dehydratase